MPRQTLIRALLVWVAILLVAILNGALRDAVIVNFMGSTAARFLSGIILCAVIIAAAVLTARWIGTIASHSRWWIGALWLLLTVGFELAVGYAQHQSWQPLLDAYKLQGGNLWPLVLLTTFVAPWLGSWIRERRS